MREKAEEIFEWGVAQRDDKERIEIWKNHSYAAAKVMEKVAANCGLDEDRAYTYGLLHDIGKYKGSRAGMNHVWLGYEKMMEEGMPDVAKICLTHSFNPKDKIAVLNLENEEHQKFIERFISDTEYDDYDLLMQLTDYMAGAHGITTIERRFCSVLARHNLPNARRELLALYRIKVYFDEKCGKDIYELFRDELMESVFRGLPGNIAEDYKIKSIKEDDE